MSESGFPFFYHKPVPANPSVSPSPPPPEEIVVRLVELGAVLRTVERALQIAAEVTRRNADGTIVLKTERGEITIALRPGVPPPEPGQIVTVTLPPGAPPRQATITPAPQAPVTTTPVPMPDETAFYTPRTIPVNAPPPATYTAAQGLAPQPLPPEAIVRFFPLPGPLPEISIQASSPQAPMSQQPGSVPVTLPSATPVLQQPVILPSASPLSPPAGAPYQNSATPPSATPSMTTTAPAPPLPALLQGLMKAPAFLSQLLAPAPLPAQQSFSPAPAMPVPVKTATSFPAPAVLPPPAPAQLLSAPVAFDAAVIAITSPDQTTPGVKIALPPNALQVTVTQHTQAALPVVTINPPVTAPAAASEAPGPAYVLSFPATNLPPGTQITLQPQSTVAPAPAPATSSYNAPVTLPALMSGLTWPALDDLLAVDMTAFARVSETASALSQILPNPARPGTLPAAALFFLSAIRAGDMNGWLGEKSIDLFRRAGKTEALQRLGREFTALRALMNEAAPAQEWRMMPLPLYSDQQVQKMFLYYRHNDRDAESADGERSRETRFILDLTLNRMGAVQLDGLVRGRKLDLALRTLQPFSEAMRQDLRQRYVHVLDVAGLSGELSFQSRPESWVKIPLPPGGWQFSI